MSDSQTPTATRWFPPYTAFRTVTDIIDRMEQEEPPARIDKSYLDNYSGGYQSIVLAALNNLGFRDESGKVTQRLEDLVKADAEKRKALFADLLHEYYQPVLDLGLNATQAQLIEAFRELGVNPGDTTRKAVAFFLAAAKFSGIPVSRHWKVPRVPSSGKPRRTTDTGSGAASGSTGTTTDDENPNPGGSPNSRTVQLRSGGTIKLQVSVDLFELSPDDQMFVLDLVKKLRDYGDQRSLPAGLTALTNREPEDLPDEDEEVEDDDS